MHLIKIIEILVQLSFPVWKKLKNCLKGREGGIVTKMMA